MDLVFSNVNNVNVFQVTCPRVPLDCIYHPTLLIKLSVLFLEFLDYKEQIYDFKNCDYNIIRSNIASIDWNGLLKCLNINEAVSIFYKNIFKIINLHCPKKYLYTPKHPLWFSGTLKNLIFKKKINHIIYKRLPTQTNYNNFSNIRGLCKRLNKIDYENFISGTQSSIITNPKLV